MKIFGWKSVGRALARPARGAVPLARGFGGVSLGEWPRSYEAQVRDGYLNNAVAQRAVRLVAEGVASVPLTASDPVGLALLRATTGGQSLLETVACQLLLHGNAYVQMLTAADGQCNELFALRPERVSIEADVHGWPASFRYKAGDVAVRLSASDIIHIRTHHPLDDHYGLGCLGAASGPIAIHNASSRWNKALLDNAARPSGALVHDGAEALTTDQFDRLKTELAQSFSGTDNAGRPMLLEGGLKWQSLSLSPADMDFAGMKAAAAREIALAFGVPSMLLGLPGDATYANYREANKALWRQAILPLAAKILDGVAQGLQPWFAGLTLAVDFDQVTALSEDRERLWAQVSAADFLTTNEKRVAVGLAPLEEGAPDFERLADTKGRTVRAYGTLRLEPEQRRSRSAQSNAGKPDRLPSDHGGHFIGRQFGGPEISYNHFAQNARFNVSDYRKLENEWAAELRSKRKVKVDIRASYSGRSKRPDRIRIKYYLNGKLLRRSFPNFIGG
jgi:HK97 family phage portal protein